MKISKFILTIIYCFYLSIYNLNAAQITTLTDIDRPILIEVDKNNIYVCEDFEIKVFSKKTKKLIQKIGKKGEGPGEFRDSPIPQLLEDKIVVYSSGKLSFFKYDGSFINDIKIHKRSKWVKKVADEKYIGFKLLAEPDDFYITYNLLDNEFKVVKEFYRGQYVLHKNRTKDLFETTFFDTYNGKIIYAHNKGFKVDVLDKDGNLITKIRRDEKEIPFTDEDRRKILDFWKTHPDYRTAYKILEKITIFPKKYPAILTCRVTGNKIYIITYLQKKQKSECFIYDLKGNFVKRTFIPLKSDSPFMRSYPFDIYEGNLFQLIDNLETETWTLHSESI
jgi:hypothetical protein